MMEEIMINLVIYIEKEIEYYVDNRIFNKLKSESRRK